MKNLRSSVFRHHFQIVTSPLKLAALALLQVKNTSNTFSCLAIQFSNNEILHGSVVADALPPAVCLYLLYSRFAAVPLALYSNFIYHLLIGTSNPFSVCKTCSQDLVARLSISIARSEWRQREGYARTKDSTWYVCLASFESFDHAYPQGTHSSAYFLPSYYNGFLLILSFLCAGALIFASARILMQQYVM